MNCAPGAACGVRARVMRVNASRLARGSASSAGKASISASASSRAKPLVCDSRCSRLTPRQGAASASRRPSRSTSASSHASSPASTASAISVAVTGLVMEPQCQLSAGVTATSLPTMRRPAQTTPLTAAVSRQPAAKAGTSSRRRRRAAASMLRGKDGAAARARPDQASPAKSPITPRRAMIIAPREPGPTWRVQPRA